MPVGEGIERMDQALHMDPALGVLADGELTDAEIEETVFRGYGLRPSRPRAPLHRRCAPGREASAPHRAECAEMAVPGRLVLKDREVGLCVGRGRFSIADLRAAS